MSKPLSKTDRVIAALFAVLFLLLAVFSLENDTYWGDDFAAYINEGIAIADGRLDEQVRLNYYYHPSELPEEADSDIFVYPWGLPLLHAAVYKAIGFDRENFDSIVYYKLSSAAALAITAATLYLLCRRRFCLIMSVAITALFCSSLEWFTAIHMLCSDMVFLALTVASFLLLERFVKEPNGGKKVAEGIILGAVLWFSKETRPNGIVVIVAALIGHIASLIGNRTSKKLNVAEFAPYITLTVLVVVTEYFIFMPATSKSSDLFQSGTTGFLSNTVYYFVQLSAWLKSLLLHKEYSTRIESVGNIAVYILWALTVLGMAAKGFKKQNLHLMVFTIAIFLGSAALPYVQELRYLYCIIPFIMIFMGEGLMTIYRAIFKEERKFLKKIRKPVGVLMTIGAVLLSVYAVRIDFTHDKWLADTKPVNSGVYSPAAIEVFKYIMEETDEDAVICCAKPRALYLNTERKSFPLENGHKLEEADFYLLMKRQPDYVELSCLSGAETVFNNDEFTLYSLVEKPDIKVGG